jgi:hypothetical protein
MSSTCIKILDTLARSSATVLQKIKLNTGVES